MTCKVIYDTFAGTSVLAKVVQRRGECSTAGIMIFH